MDTLTAIPVNFTPGAVEEIRKLMDRLPADSGKCLRLGVKGGGCAGFSYILDFDVQNQEDELYLVHGFPIIINRAQSIYLVGTTIDFQLGLNARGFTFGNPNASGTCGCGSSFSV
ncbi:MAG TPA: iron-sulfur cluster assembly accessory protein [Chitinophagaceae bacterium]|nr:iron-sulfur cluster assembly accessory protein [Chitinophagaceae bacterium]